MFQATVSAYMLSSIFLELRLWATVFQAKTLEISFLDNLLIFSQLHEPMHICMYHHEGLSFES